MKYLIYTYIIYFRYYLFNLFILYLNKKVLSIYFKKNIYLRLLNTTYYIYRNINISLLDKN